MPTYEYRCSFCGPFTRFRSIREDTATSDCPDCGQAATRVFTIPQVIDRTAAGRRARQTAAEAKRSLGAAPESRAATQPAHLLGDNS